MFVAHAIDFTCGKKGGGIFCHGVEGEEEDDSDLDSDYEDDYDHGDNQDLEELLVDSDDDEEEVGSNDGQEDDEGYTASKRAYLNRIDNFKAASDDDNEDDDNKNENDEGEEEKDEGCYRREGRALNRIEVIAKLRKDIEEAQSMRHLVRTAVVEAQEDTRNKVSTKFRDGSQYDGWIESIIWIMNCNM